MVVYWLGKIKHFLVFKILLVTRTLINLLLEPRCSILVCQYSTTPTRANVNTCPIPVHPRVSQLLNDVLPNSRCVHKYNGTMGRSRMLQQILIIHGTVSNFWDFLSERNMVHCFYLITIITSMHSSRMRTARLLPVSPSMYCSRMRTEFLTHASENITLPQLRCRQ